MPWMNGDQLWLTGCPNRPYESVIARPLCAPTASFVRQPLRGPLGELVLAVDGSWPWLQVYTGDQMPAGQRRRSLAVEPMTCPPNALADDQDLLVLEPDADWSGTWSLAWTAAL